MSVPDRLTLGVTDVFRTVAPHTPHHTQTGPDRPRKYSGPRKKNWEWESRLKLNPNYD